MKGNGSAMALFKTKKTQIEEEEIMKPSFIDETIDEMGNFELDDFDSEDFGEEQPAQIDSLGDMGDFDDLFGENPSLEQGTTFGSVVKDEPKIESPKKKGLFGKKEKTSKEQKKKKSKKDIKDEAVERQKEEKQKSRFSKKETKPNKNMPPENYGEDFKAKFGKISAFTEAYGNDPHITIAYDRLTPIKVNVSSRPAREITVINSSQYSRDSQFVIPFIKQRNLSYVVYDPDNFYYNTMADNMRDNGYDVQVIDFANKDHRTRIDLFEATNITHNAYWLSIILTSALRCTKEEMPCANSLFVSMMQYLLATEGEIQIEKMYILFKHVKENNEVAFKKMLECRESKLHMERYLGTEDDIKKNVLEKMLTNFFQVAMFKARNANIFSVTAHQKKTIYFVKKAPKKYTFLLTTLLFNIKSTNVLCADNEVCTAIIDIQNDNWCNEELLDRVCDEAGVSHRVMELHIRDSIGTMDKPCVNDHQLLIYMCTNDYTTKRYIQHCTKVKTTYTDDELKALGAQEFATFGIPQNVYEAAPITMEELENMGRECIIIDMTRKVKPIKVTKLN